MKPWVNKCCKFTVLSVALPLACVSATQAAIELNFETPSLPSVGNEQLLNYYNGGTDQYGNTGPNYGISFGTDALALGQYPAAPGSNTGNEPDGGNALIFLTGTGDLMNVAAGFTTGFSFYYDCPANLTGSINVYSGINGTGTLLASLTLPGTSVNSTEPFFGNWTPIGVAFSGTAESVDFSGTANEIAFSDVTLDSSTPILNPVPEPTTVLSGALLMLPLGWSALRKIRANRAA